MSQNNNNDNDLSIDFGDELSKNLTIHKNVKQEIIITTEDKIKLVLISTREILASHRDWWTPFGLLISFIATLCTADFKDALGLTKDVWHAIFIILTGVSAIWLIRCLYKLGKNWGEDDLAKIIEKIKLRNTQTNTQAAVAVEAKKKLLIEVPISTKWRLNHWEGNCAVISDNKMVFSGTTCPNGTDGSHIDLSNVFVVGKNYEVSCFVKSEPNTSGMFQLWCHDTEGNASVQTIYKTPSNVGETITLKFTAESNKHVRIHLQYTPGLGKIEVSDVRLFALTD